MSDDPFNYLMAKDWSKPFANRVKRATRSDNRWNEAQLATLEAVVRRLVRRGWTRRRTSTDNRPGRLRGRATSRYLVIGAYEIRLSNHVLSERDQSGEKRHFTWRRDYVITDQVVRTYNVLGLIQQIERDYKQSKQGRGVWSGFATSPHVSEVHAH